MPQAVPGVLLEEIGEEGQKRAPVIWVVLPAYNEEASLPPLLERIAQSLAAAELPYRIVVVDDGSRDRTLAIAESYAARLPMVIERHVQNLGLGATIRDGLLKAAELAAREDVVIAMDADNSHDPELMPRMAARIAAGDDVVIASRYQPGSSVRGVPASRRAFSYAASLLFRAVFPTAGVRDYTSGYRAYRAALLQEIAARHGRDFFDQSGFQCMVDILLKLRRLPVRFSEVPLALRYDMKQGPSKMRVGRTIGQTLALIIKRRLQFRRVEFRERAPDGGPGVPEPRRPSDAGRPAARR